MTYSASEQQLSPQVSTHFHQKPSDENVLKFADVRKVEHPRKCKEKKITYESI